MNLNHLHLHVRDVDESRRFYEDRFGFRLRVRHGDILFLRNDDGFDLALAPDPSPEPLPPWFHFGCRLHSREAVRSLHDRLRETGARLDRELVDEPDLVSFRVVDPDGYRIEVYWE